MAFFRLAKAVGASTALLSISHYAFAADSNTIAEKCSEHTNFITKGFCEGGYPIMTMIAVTFAFAMFVIVDRFFKMRELVVDKKTLNENLFALILRGEIKQAIAFCDRMPAPLTNTMKEGLVQVLNKRPDEEVQVAMDAAVLRETPRLEGLTAFLAIIGNVAVLIGLLGTIAGLIVSFSAVNKADPAQKAAELSMGISHALNCTFFGLMVAIISIVAFGYFQHKIGRAINDMMENSMTLMNLVVANRDKMKD